MALYSFFLPTVGSAAAVRAQAYAAWAAELALSSYDGVPWIMCQQDDAPDSMIATCNGFYCDGWIDGHRQRRPGQPAMFTENWPGWFQAWGEPVPHRPAVDVAFSVARFVARGGTLNNYYMYHGACVRACLIGR